MPRPPYGFFLLLVAAGLSLRSPLVAQPVQPLADTIAADTARLSPRAAMVRSFVIPGWGQAYVGAPGRGALYFGVEAASVWMVYKSHQQLRAARDLERSLHAEGALPLGERLQVVRSREAQVEDWLTWSIFVLLFSGADAYVAAQLADFDERFGVRPGANGRLQLEARLPLGWRR